MWDTIHATSQLVKRGKAIDFTVYMEEPPSAIITSVLLVLAAIITVLVSYKEPLASGPQPNIFHSSNTPSSCS